MKKRFVLFLLLFLVNQLSNAQSFWAYTAGSIKEDETMDICYDNNGNIISAGYFAGQTTFAPGIILNSNSNGNPDVYISKSNAAGQIIWVVKAGGNGSDRAISVATDANGNTYITGFYYATANFGATTLTSVSGSQDGFIAKLDANGVFVWAKSFGGTLAEWGNSIAVDAAGDPIITGQFQGTANFSGTSVISMINPNTAFSSFDVFVAKYTSAGNITWVRTGKAKFDDRGIDIIADAQSNVYVCGQFSDTIQFNNPHNNAIMNAAFIIKYDASGQEIWWKKAAGVFSIANAMVMDNANNIYITGDFQGTLAYFGTPSTSIVNGAFANKAFLIKIDNTGNFIWGKADASTNYLSSKNVALDGQQNPYIFGEFGCTHSEYSAVYGPGVFNSIGFQDFFITKFNTSGTRQWFRSLGGPRNDKAHGLLLAGIDEPIMAGSYEAHLNIPSTYGTLTQLNNNNNGGWGVLAQQPLNYCSAPNNYDNYYSLNCNGYSDMFIHKGLDLTRNPYDYYERSGTTCNLNFVGNCIDGGFSFSPTNCPDTINYCLNGFINCNTKTGEQSGYGIGPIQHYIWNNSLVDTLQILYVTTSGYKTVIAKTLDDCYTSKDTVYVKINPLPPPPTITDSYGANTLQLPLTNSIAICGPSTITLTGGSVQNTTYNWIGGVYLTNHDSISTINSTGIYTFQVVDNNGCINRNYIDILIDSPITLPTFIPKQKNDSIEICFGEYKQIIVYDAITNPTGNYPYNCIQHYVNTISSTSGLFTNHGNYLPCDFSFDASANSTGWYHYSKIYGFQITTLCNTQTYTVVLNDSIYIKVKPNPTGILSITGNTLVCPGDSSLITISSLSVSPNTSYTLNPTNSVWITGNSSVSYSLNFIDTISGCSNSIISTLVVLEKPNPFIILSPYNSIICPNDSVKMTINLAGATNYQWFGPNGIIPSNTQSIYSHTNGFYHCIVTDNTGCVFTTNTIELKQYATPYLISAPSNVICNNQPVSLHVITLDSTLIVWQSPLSGGGASQTINSPGTYSCSVTMCNIVTPLSILIVGSNPVATISALGPLIVCPFDSVTLTGNNGMINYIWQPGNHLGQNYNVHTAGSYTLEVMDIYGCIAKSTPVTITFSSNIAPPVLGVNDTICAGQIATLSVTATNGNAVQWFQNSNSGSVLQNSNVYTTPILSNQTTYYAASVSGIGCHSIGIPVTAYIYQTSQLPLLLVDTTICKHDTLKITTPFISGATYNWAINGVSTTALNVISIPNADSTKNGIYALYISGNGCSSPTVSVSIQVLNPLVPSITSHDTICQNSNYMYAINPINTNYTYNWSGPNNFTSTNDSLIIISGNVNQSGTYNVTSAQLGCVSAVSILTLTILQTPPLPVIITNSVVCIGDTIFLNTIPNSNYNYMWFGQNGFTSNQTNTFVTASDTSYSGIYGLIASNVFCPSMMSLDTIKVMPYPTMQTSHDTIACDNILLNLSTVSDFTNYAWNTGATSNNITVAQSGVYWIKTSNGNCVKTDTIHVTLVPCSSFVINVFTPNGDGVNDFFKFSSPAITQIHCEIMNRWGEKVAEFDGKENGWNGQHIGNKISCEEGTYFYVANISTIDGAKQVLKGFMSLIR